MGYGYAAVELIRAWQRMGIPVWGYDVDCPVIFNFGQPHFYERVEGKLNIGYTPWESTGVPGAWVRSMNTMDEVWTTCHANASWYKEAGVKVPIRVLHHGINREQWAYKHRSRNSKYEPIKFLHVGEPSPRKGGRLVYEVFKDTFGESDDVHLTLKGRPRFETHGSNVTVVSEELKIEELVKLHYDNHFMIYPTNGEGFGFIPFQAAASGMPTAVTNWSGPEDYMNLCYPISLSNMVEPDYEPHTGLWAEPAPSSIEMWMADFANSPGYFFNKQQIKVSGMDNYWSWDNIAKIAVEYMTENLK